jgi:hypothetical protein
VAPSFIVEMYDFQGGMPSFTSLFGLLDEHFVCLIVDADNINAGLQGF